MADPADEAGFLLFGVDFIEAVVLRPKAGPIGLRQMTLDKLAVGFQPHIRSAI